MRVIGRGLALVAAVVLLVCAGSSALSAASRPAVAARGVDASVVHQRCASLVGALDGTLEGLRSRLPIGLALDAYATRVGAARFFYDRLLRRAWSDGAVDDRCTHDVVAPLAAALDAYVRVYASWDDCTLAGRCAFGAAGADGAALPRTRSEWQRAGVLTDRAETALRLMRFGRHASSLASR